MKKLILSLACIACSLGVYAQGTVNFANAGFQPPATVLNSPFTDTDGTTLLSGSYKVELLGAAGTGQPAGSLTSLLIATPSFASGNFSAGTATLAGAAGGPGTFMVRVWETTYASFAIASTTAGARIGQSSVFSLNTTGNPTAVPAGTPALLIGLNAVSLTIVPVPEPSTFALLGLGAAGLLIRRRK